MSLKSDKQSRNPLRYSPELPAVSGGKDLRTKLSFKPELCLCIELKPTVIPEILLIAFHKRIPADAACRRRLASFRRGNGLTQYAGFVRGCDDCDSCFCSF